MPRPALLAELPPTLLAVLVPSGAVPLHPTATIPTPSESSRRLFTFNSLAAGNSEGVSSPEAW